MHPLLTQTHAPALGNAVTQDPSRHRETQVEKDGKTDADVSFAAVFGAATEEPTDAVAAGSEILNRPMQAAETDANTDADKIATVDEGGSEAELSNARPKPDNAEPKQDQAPDLMLPDSQREEAQSSAAHTHKESEGLTISTRGNQGVMSRPKGDPVDIQGAQKNYPNQIVTSARVTAPSVVENNAEPLTDEPSSVSPKARDIHLKKPETIPPFSRQSDPQLSVPPKNGVEHQKQVEASIPLNNQPNVNTSKEPRFLTAPLITAPQATGSQQTKRTLANESHHKTDMTAPFLAPKKAAPSAPIWNAVQSMLTPNSTEPGRMSPSLEPDTLVTLRVDAQSAAATSQQQALPARADLPHHLARQIAEALQYMPNRPVEITLSPEELGRVRLGVSTVDGSIVVSVIAERPETSDLMRRHISSLEAAFQELGYSEISFSFGGDGGGESSGDKNAQRNLNADQNNSDDAMPQISQLHLNSTALTGVDIRL